MLGLNALLLGAATPLFIVTNALNVPQNGRLEQREASPWGARVAEAINAGLDPEKVYITTVTDITTDTTTTECDETSTASAGASIPTKNYNTTISASLSSSIASATASQPNGGVLSIPPSAATPIASLLASRDECEALLDNQLPPKNSIPSNYTFSGNVRTYYVAAEQIAWNYAPSGWDNWLGVPVSESPRAFGAGYLNLTGSLGADGGFTWQKAVYKGYTDDTFTTQTEQAPTNGINGPTLRAEVNDMIQILFINNLPDHYATMHSMGMYYGKQYEGSLYPNTTTGQSPQVQEQDAVPPGGCAVYKWLVSDSQAPSPGQNSRLWSYHSYVNMPGEMAAGLVGPIIVYNSGTMNNTMSSHREFIINYDTFSEQQSMLAGTNAAAAGLTNLTTINTLIGRPHVGNETFWVPQLANFPAVALTAAQGPVFYTLNGWVFANGPPYEMCRDDPVIWYLMSYGEYSHVFHMHGNNFLYNGNWQATLGVNVGEMFTLTMDAQLPGVWQVICHVASHVAFGMQQNYVVYETEDGETCPLPPLTAKLNGSP